MGLVYHLCRVFRRLRQHLRILCMLLILQADIRPPDMSQLFFHMLFCLRWVLNNPYILLNHVRRLSFAICRLGRQIYSHCIFCIQICLMLLLRILHLYILYMLVLLRYRLFCLCFIFDLLGMTEYLGHWCLMGIHFLHRDKSFFRLLDKQHMLHCWWVNTCPRDTKFVYILHQNGHLKNSLPVNLHLRLMYSWLDINIHRPQPGLTFYSTYFHSLF